MNKNIIFQMLLILLMLNQNVLCNSNHDKGDNCTVAYGPGWHICHFDAPSVLLNKGSIIDVTYISNPATGKWIETVKAPWSHEYLDFENKGDEVHNGLKLIILKPVTIAFTNFKGGPLLVSYSKPPVSHTVQKNPPVLIR
jgi:hypothetical protein